MNLIDKVKERTELNKTLYKLIEDKNYNEIYNQFGRDAFLSLTPKSYLKKDINNLLINEQFEEIINKYGIVEPYCLNVNAKYFNEEINSLIEEKKYDEIYYKYGKSDNKKFKLYRDTIKISKDMHISVLNKVSTYICTFILFHTMFWGAIVKSNIKNYKNKLKEYNKKIEIYADDINSYELTDLEIIMKTMADIKYSANTINGEKVLDISGYWRLDMNEDGSVCCRHMADDFTARMNAINPKYKARNLTAYLANEVNCETVDLDTCKIKTFTGIGDGKDDIYTRKLGNHLVTLLNIPDTNIILMVDPTNLYIGVYKDEIIYNFNDSDTKHLMKASGGVFKQVVQGITNWDIYFKDLRSHFNDYDIEKLEKEYGVEAQAEALKHVKSLEGKIK